MQVPTITVQEVFSMYTPGAYPCKFYFFFQKTNGNQANQIINGTKMYN